LELGTYEEPTNTAALLLREMGEPKVPFLRLIKGLTPKDKTLVFG